MIELIILILLWSKIGSNARTLRRSAIGYQLMMVALFFLGEFAGGILGSILHFILYQDSSFSLIAYFCAILGAGCGALIAFVIVDNLPAAPTSEFATHAKSDADIAWETKMLLRKALTSEARGEWDQAIAHFEQVIALTEGTPNAKLAQEHIRAIREKMPESRAIRPNLPGNGGS